MVRCNLMFIKTHDVNKNATHKAQLGQVKCSDFIQRFVGFCLRNIGRNLTKNNRA